MPAPLLLLLDRPGSWALLAIAALAGGCELGERKLPYAKAPPAQMVRGQQLLAQYQCGSCHAIPDVPSRAARSARRLRPSAARSYIAGRVPNRSRRAGALDRLAASAGARHRDAHMGVSPADARDMAAYLLALE